MTVYGLILKDMARRPQQISRNWMARTSQQQELLSTTRSLFQKSTLTQYAVTRQAQRHFPSETSSTRFSSLYRLPDTTKLNNLNEPNRDNSNINSDRDDNYSAALGPNPGLASIISRGIKSLEKSAADIEYQTRNSSLSRPHKKGSFQEGTLEPRQLAEGQRVLDVALDCLQDLLMQDERGGLTEGQRKGLILFGEPIVLLECVVNRNIKQGKIYWTLPYGILFDQRINQRVYQQLTVKIQKQLMEGGGAKLLARQVHARLSSYYPPRLKMLPATDDMVGKAIAEYML